MTAFRLTLALPFARPLPGLRRVLQRRDLRRSRAALARLEDRLLADIGLTRQEAEAEARATDDPAGWDAPAHWRR